jgi:tetratricopeptide (TPR) repeat protein
VGWRLPTLAAVLWVVALGMWAAVATGPAGGPWGAAAGSVLTLLAGVVTAYIPSIRDEYRRRAAEREQAREALRQATELPVTGSPAGLLDPRRGVAGFLGRRHELSGLVAWCEHGRPRGVRLVTGPGGVGKTRLSVELCARLTALGWRCERLGDGGEAAALEAVRRVHRGRVLLVVDYAETRAGLGALLRAVAADGGPVRVLLLARSGGEWWERLAAGEPAVRELLVAAEAGDPLPVPVAEGLSNDEVIAAAVPGFAAALGVAPPARVEVRAGTGSVRVLDLHAVALVAVLRSVSAGRVAVRVQVEDVLDELLGHEARFWQGSAARLGLTDGVAGLTAGDLRRVIAAGTLLGAASREEAVDLLGRVPGVAGSMKMAEWLRGLYPPTEEEGSWLGSLAPDRLAEHLVVQELGYEPELASRCLTGLDQRQALRAITVLGRAAADEEDAGGLLERLLPLVEQVVAGLPADLGLLVAIKDAIPFPSASLAAADRAVTRRILDLIPAGQSEHRAAWLDRLSTSLIQTGRSAQAQAAAEESVAIFRKLASADPDYRPALGHSLISLGDCFSKLGDMTKAVSATKEAVSIYRKLSVADPDRYPLALANSLNHLSTHLRKQRRSAEALSVTEEAVAIYRELPATSPVGYRANLADLLISLGTQLLSDRSERSAEGLPTAEEGVAIYRELAVAQPDPYRADLASRLIDMTGVLLLPKKGRSAEALSMAEEAVAIYRELAVAYPYRYLPRVVSSLGTLSVALRRVGRSAEARSAEEESEAIDRQLVAILPDHNRARLAEFARTYLHMLEEPDLTSFTRTWLHMPEEPDLTSEAEEPGHE